MARLPTPMMVDDLQFFDNTTLVFTVKWAADDPYASMIDHIRVRFMMTNFLYVGVDDDAVLAEMESWEDLPLMGMGLSAVAGEMVPIVGWYAALDLLHRIDYRSPVIVTPDMPSGGIHVELFNGITSVAFQQRFVRLIAQARTAD